MATNLPSISRECNNNLTHVSVGSMEVSFSYTTPVAFRYSDEAPNGTYMRVVSVNVWSMTTGKHLNAIDGGDKRAKEARVPHDLFVTLLDLMSRPSLKNVAKAERLLSTHQALVNSGLKAVG